MQLLQHHLYLLNYLNSLNVVSKVRKEAKEIEVEEKQEVAQTDKELATEDSGSESGGSGLSKNTMLLIGAGAVGLFLLTRKK